MPFSPEQLREHRRKLRERGICTRCHREKAEEGFRQCSGCRKTLQAALKVSKAKWRAGTTQCVHCGAPRHEWMAYCSRCREANRRRLVRRRDRLKAEGRCIKCGRWAPKGYATCAICEDQQKLGAVIRRSLA